MKLLVINPVGHTTWNDQDKELYQSYAPGAEITVVSLPKGPPSVETAEAHREVIPSVIEVAKKMNEDFDAVIVNCFLDPGVDVLKKELTKPVIGPCEASLAIASLIGTRVGVVTVHGKALSMIRSKVRQMDHRKRVVSVTGIPMGVLELNDDSEQTKHRVVEKGEELKDRHRVNVICLGCTGLGGLARVAQQDIRVPVIDPIGASVELARAALHLNLYSSGQNPMQSRQIPLK